MPLEYLVKLLLGGLCTLTFAILAYYAKDLVSTVKDLTTALHTNAAETKRLAEHVERIDQENTSLRKSHAHLTTWLIHKGILPPPPPPSSPA
jgi:hypothetical protein